MIRFESDYLEGALPEEAELVTALLPCSQAGIAAQVRREGMVEQEEYVAEGLRITARASGKLLALLKEYQIRQE